MRGMVNRRREERGGKRGRRGRNWGEGSIHWLYQDRPPWK